MSNEKYKMFMQYLHNELGITKEDIREWTQEAVTAVAADYLAHHMSDDRTLDRAVERALNSGLVKHDWLKREIANRFMDKVEVRLKDE